MRTCVFLLFAWIGLAPTYGYHPSLILDASELAGLAARAGTDPVVKAWRQSVLATAEQALSATAPVFDRGAGWYHDYFCPQHGAMLRYLPSRGHECPIDGKVFTGEPYDSAHLYFVYSDALESVYQLGLAYALSGRVEFASRTRQYLLTLAQQYPTLPLHGKRAGPPPRDGARLFSQTLDEAVGGLRLLWAYDSTCNSPVYSASDRQRIETRLFREMIRTIRRPPPGPSNWHTWHNAYMLCAGYLLGDTNLVQQVLDGPWGVRDQLRQCVDGDGFWHEGSIGYHFYALEALVYSAEAAFRHGTDLWADGRLISMFTAPLAFAWPDGVLPAINDSQRQSLSDFADLYRVAYYRTHKEELRFPFFSQPNQGFYAALYPPPGPRPREVLLRYKSQRLASAGLALLRNQRQPQDAALLKFGPHGGGHGHCDKLELLLFCRGQERLLDPGTVPYGVPSYPTWYKTTLAHNTLVVDGRTQNPAAGRGLGFGETPAGDWARAACDTAYSGVRMDRTVFLGPDFLVDVFRVDADEPHTYDLAYHATGRLALNVEAASGVIPLATDAAPAYGYLSNVRTASGAAPWKASITDGSALLRLWGLADQQTLFLADAPGLRPTELVPMLLVRRQAASTLFVHVLDWSVEGLPWDHTIKDGDVIVRVQPPSSGVRYVLTFPQDPKRAVAAARQ